MSNVVIRIDRKVLWLLLAVVVVPALFLAGIGLGRMTSRQRAGSAPVVSAPQSNAGIRSQSPGNLATQGDAGISTAPLTTPAPAAQGRVPIITVDEVKQKLDRGEDLVVVDIRGQGAYDNGHVPGAVSMPEGTLETMYRKLPQNKEIIVY